MRRVAVLARLVAVRAAAARSCFRTSSPLTGIINSLRLKRYVIPPHFTIERYFSEQSSLKDVALQVCPWICAVVAAQVSARVAARRRLRSQRRRMSVCPTGPRRSALATSIFLCPQFLMATWPLRQGSAVRVNFLPVSERYLLATDAPLASGTATKALLVSYRTLACLLSGF